MPQNNIKYSYLTVKQLAKKYPFLKDHGWRWRIANDKVFRKACVRVFGKRILINEAKLIAFLESL